MLYINDAIHQWEASRDIWVVEFDLLTGESENTIEDNNKLCEKLKALRDRMQYHYTNVTALRDGLFNASAVMESRASTRLGG
jgi:spermidine/putrescine-binding protein